MIVRVAGCVLALCVGFGPVAALANQPGANRAKLVRQTTDGHQTTKLYVTPSGRAIERSSNRFGQITVESANYKIVNDSLESGVRYDRSHVRSVEDFRTGKRVEVSFPRPIPDRLRGQAMPSGPGEPLFVDGKDPRTVHTASGRNIEVRSGKWGDTSVEGPRYRIVGRSLEQGARLDRTYVRSVHDKSDGKLTEVSYPKVAPMRVLERQTIRDAGGRDSGVALVTYGKLDSGEQFTMVEVYAPPRAQGR